MKDLHFPCENSILNARFFYIVLVNAFIFSALALHTSFYEFGKEFLISGFYNFSLYFFVLSFISFLGKRVFNISQNILFVLHFILLIINVFLIFNVNATLSNTSFEIMLATNSRELKEFFAFYATFKNILIIFSACLFTFLFWKLKFKIACPPSFYLILLFLLPFTIKYYQIESEQKLQTSFKKVALFHPYSILKSQMNDETNFVKIVQSFDENWNKIIEKTPKDYIQMENKIPKIVLILGESTQRNYMGVYNYPLNTTPRLKKLEENKNLFVFKDVISPDTSTNKTLRYILTFANQENKKQWHKEMNLIDAMKLLNYQSIWLSNQDADVGNIWGNIAHAIGRRSEVLKYSAFLSSLEMLQNKSPKDGILLNMYDNLPPPPPQSNQFILFHLMGAHYQYHHRYPESFQKFKAEDLIQNNLNKTYYKQTEKFQRVLNKDELKVRSNYLNAIYYNDFVVAQIIEKFKDNDVIVFYLSDHGQDIYDDITTMAGHGSGMPTRGQIEVPFMIYVSDQFKEKHPEILNKIQRALNKPFMTDDFMHAVFDLLNIECKDLNKNLSLFNENYQIKDRMVGEIQRNYDAAFIRQEFSKK